jgi:hypothetical protein
MPLRHGLDGGAVLRERPRLRTQQHGPEDCRRDDCSKSHGRDLDRGFVDRGDEGDDFGMLDRPQQSEEENEGHARNDERERGDAFGIDSVEHPPPKTKRPRVH